MHRNAVVLVAPSSAGLEVARKSVRERLGWEDVQAQLKVQGNDPGRDQLVADFARKAQRAVPEAIRHAWTIVVTADTDSAVKAFRVRLNTDDPLFATVKSDERIRIQDQAVNTDALLPGCDSESEKNRPIGVSLLEPEGVSTTLQAAAVHVAVCLGDLPVWYDRRFK